MYIYIYVGNIFSSANTPNIYLLRIIYIYIYIYIYII